MKKVSILLIITLYCLALTCNISQASVVAFNLEDLVKSADSIVIGTVEKNEINEGLDNKVYGYPVRVKIHCASIKVEKFLKKDLKKSTIMICTTEYPNIGITELEIGKRYLVAIAENDDKESYRITGANGVFSFENNVIADKYLGYFEQGTPLGEVIKKIEEVIE